MDIKWNMACLSLRANDFQKRYGKKIVIRSDDPSGFDKSKVECFNCHKHGHFARECRAPKVQEGASGYRKEEKKESGMIAIDGVGFDWSFMEEEAKEQKNAAYIAEESPKEFALMAKTTSSKSTSSSDNEVYDESFCSKGCRKNTEKLNARINELLTNLADTESRMYNYKRGLAQVNSTLVEYREREKKYCESIRVLERDLHLSLIHI